MSIIGERVREVRKNAKKTQKEFAQLLGLTENYVWQVEKGQRDLSERTLNDVCRVFEVNPRWIRTGEGEPFLPQSREERITEILSKAMTSPSTARDRLCRALARLPDDAFPLIEQYILSMAASILDDSSKSSGPQSSQESKD